MIVLKKNKLLFSRRRRFPFRLFILIIPGFIFFCSACQGPVVSDSNPVAKKGVIDLQNIDFYQNEPLEIVGKWGFYLNQFLSATDHSSLSEKTYINVPGDWNEFSGEDLETSGFGYASYQVRILLPKKRPQLALQLKGFSTAFELEINGDLVWKNGKISRKEEGAQAEFKPVFLTLPEQGNEISLIIRGSNWHHYQGGILVAPKIGSLEAMQSAKDLQTFWGGLLFGAFILAGLMQMALFIFRPKAVYSLWFSLGSLILALHILCLTDRWLYTFIGADLWSVAYKIELSTMLLAIGALLPFYNLFFGQIIPKRVLQFIALVWLLEILIFIVLPSQIASQMELIFPINVIIFSIFSIFIFVRAVISRNRDVWVMIFFSLAAFPFMAKDGFFINLEVVELTYSHTILLLYVLIVSILLAKRFAQSFSQVEKLKNELEQQNRTLEVRVKDRTEKLVEVEKRAHELELNEKTRDLESIVQTNRAKSQLAENMITSLEELLQSSPNSPQALSRLINELKVQNSSQEKFQILQEKMDEVNTGFYDRLQEQFPILTKTEREICAFIKLNMSNQEIASLRKTTVNTIHVTRSRIRKKFSLSRKIELEAFINRL